MLRLKTVNGLVVAGRLSGTKSGVIQLSWRASNADDRRDEHQGGPPPRQQQGNAKTQESQGVTNDPVRNECGQQRRSVVVWWNDAKEGHRQARHGEEQSGDHEDGGTWSGRQGTVPAPATAHRLRRGAEGFWRIIFISCGRGGYLQSRRSGVSRHPCDRKNARAA